MISQFDDLHAFHLFRTSQVYIREQELKLLSYCSNFLLREIPQYHGTTVPQYHSTWKMVLLIRVFHVKINSDRFEFGVSAC